MDLWLFDAYGEQIMHGETEPEQLLILGIRLMEH